MVRNQKSKEIMHQAKAREFSANTQFLEKPYEERRSTQFSSNLSAPRHNETAVGNGAYTNSAGG